MMAMEAQQSQRNIGTVGQYMVTEKIGSGSFAVVWKAKHITRGHVVAIKEIITERLHEKLQQGLLSEIHILEKISHPNIVRLHDIVPASDRIFLVLEYCAGGDLASYIQKHKRVSQTVARKIMKQLGAGLEVLRANNLIHRDLKPQNLLLTTNDDNAVLKIADFGFARSLQPQGLAETHCGSPLYMAPEILQYQKYDAKADLWSVGAILYQLVTGDPPFLGTSHRQLMNNIRNSSGLQFPKSLVNELHPDCIDLCRKLLCQNPVERLSFEEFFNHPFIQAERVQGVPESVPEVSPTASKPRTTECLPLFVDDRGQQATGTASSSFSRQPSSIKRSSVNLMQTGPGTVERAYDSNKQGLITVDVRLRSGSKSPDKHPALSSYKSKPLTVDSRQQAIPMAHRSSTKEIEEGYLSGVGSRGVTLADSMESIEREYVVVNAPLYSTEMTLSFSGVERYHSRGDSSLQANVPYVKVPGPTVISRENAETSPYSQVLIPATDSPRTKETEVGLEGPSVYPPLRLASLRRCAHVIANLATEKLGAGQPLAAFSLHLVCLSIWKEALHVCHTWAAAASEGRRFQAPEELEIDPEAIGGDEHSDPASACSAMEQEYVTACEHGEALTSHLSGIDGHDGVPDAVELIFQAALSAGRLAAVDEVLGNTVKASVVYGKSASLLHFLIEEAPSLPLKPPLVLSSLERNRLREIAHRVVERQTRVEQGTLSMIDAWKELKFLHPLRCLHLLFRVQSGMA